MEENNVNVDQRLGIPFIKKVDVALNVIVSPQEFPISDVVENVSFFR